MRTLTLQRFAIDVSGSRKAAAVAVAVRNDGLDKRLTLGLRVVRAVYKVDGLAGFYRYVSLFFHSLDCFLFTKSRIFATSGSILTKSRGKMLHVFFFSTIINID